MKKVTSVGGTFFKCEDSKKMNDWYSKNLGLVTNDYGSLFEFRNRHNPSEINHLQSSTMKNDATYFEPSDAKYMINYRVADLVALEKELMADGVTICDKIEEFEYGKLLHILDPERNKIELWEPIDKVFTPENCGYTAC